MAAFTRAVGATAYNTAANATATAAFTGGAMPTHQAGDLLLQFLTVDGGTSTTVGITAPVGWTEITNLAWGTATDILQGRVYGLKAASSSEVFTAPTVTNLTTGTSGGGAGIRVVSLANVDVTSFPGTPNSVLAGQSTFSSGAATSVSIGPIPTFTPTQDNTMICAFGGHVNGGTASVGNTLNTSVWWTEKFDDIYSGGGDHRGIMDTGPQAIAAAIAAQTFSFSTAPTAGRHGGVQFAVKSAAESATTIGGFTITPGYIFSTDATAVTTLNIPYPASPVAGDLLVLYVVSNGGVATLPGGWTQVAKPATVTNPRGIVAIKAAAGGESGSLAVTQTSSTGGGQMLKVSGVNIVTPQDATSTIVEDTTGTDATIDLPSITTATANALSLMFGNANSGITSYTGPGTELIDTGDALTVKTFSIYAQLNAAAGATGVKTITQNAARAYWGAHMVLRPRPLAPPFQPRTSRNSLLRR